MARSLDKVRFQVQCSPTSADSRRPGRYGDCLREEAPSWLAGLAWRWMADETGVLTLNYETFIEAAVDYAIVGQGRKNQRYYHVPLRPDLIQRPPTGIIDGGNAWTGALRPTLSLWKLHGSIRWYWDELTHSAESMVDVGQFLRWNYSRE